MKTLLTLADIRQMLISGKPRRRFIIPGFIPAGPALLYGASGSGKTGLAIRTAVAVAAGLQWAGLEVERGSVLYVAGEDFDNAQDRIAAAAQMLGLPDDLPIAIMEGNPIGLVSNDFRNDIELRAGEVAKRFSLPLTLIVIDTLAACFGPKSQDDATAASEYMNNAERIAKRVGCSVLSIHHTGKTESSGMRGSQVFFDRADAVIKVKAGKGATTFAEVEKLRNGVGGRRVAFEIGGIEVASSGGDLSVQVIKNLNSLEDSPPHSNEEIREKAQDNDRATALGLLFGIVKDGVASRKEWQQACYSAWSFKPSDNARRRAFSTATLKLQGEKRIAVDGDIVTVSVSNFPAHNDAHNVSPDNREREREHPSLIKGGARTHSQADGQSKAKNAETVETGKTTDTPIGKAKALHRRAGGETPAEDYCATAHAHTGTEG